MFRSRAVFNAAIIISIVVAVLFASFYLYNEFRVRKVVIATNEEGSSSHDFMVVVADEIRKENPRLDIQIVPTGGSADVMQMLEKQEADFGVAQIDTVTTSKAQTVALLYPQVYHLLVPANSSVRTMADLQGKIIATPSQAGGSYQSLLNIMGYYGLSEENVTIRAFDDEDERDAAFVNGDVDALFRASGLGSGSIRDLLTEMDARLIAFDQYEAMKVLHPELAQYTIPKGIYRAADPVVPARDILTVGVPTALFANSDVPPEIVQLFTQILFEQKQDIVRQERDAVFIEAPTQDDYFGPSVHPGALLYYNREQPGFVERYYDQISLLFTIGPILASIYFALQSRFIAKQKTKASEHNLELATLLADLMPDSDVKSARETERKLLEALNKALKDLDDGQISAADLQTFSMVWEKAMDAVRYRENMLQKTGLQEAGTAPNGKR